MLLRVRNFYEKHKERCTNINNLKQYTNVITISK
jgi:hypothetical protein